MANSFNKAEEEENGMFDVMANVTSGPIKMFRGADPKVLQEQQAIAQGAPAPAPATTPLPQEAPIPVPEQPASKADIAAAAAPGQIKALEQAQAAGEKQKADLTSTLEDEQAARDTAQRKIQEAEEIRRMRLDAISKAEADLKTRISEKEAEIAAMEPKSFWQKADTGDKILMSLAVILGGIGQGLSGSKTNAAAAAMNNAINEDLKLQQDALNRKIGALERTKAGIGEIARAKEEAGIEFKQRKTKALDIMKMNLDQLKSQTTNINTLAAIDQQNANIEKTKAALKADIDAHTKKFAENKVTRDEELNRIDPKTLDKMPPQEQAATAQALGKMNMRRVYGVGQDLKGEKAKSANLLNKNADNLQELEQLEEKLTPKQFAALKDAIQHVVNRAERKSAPVVGGLFSAIETGVRGSPAEYMEEAVPGIGGRYYNLMLNLVNDQTRFESGAAIGASEFVSTMEKYFPTATTTPEGAMQLRSARRGLLTSHKILSGVKEPLYFEKQ